MQGSKQNALNSLLRHWLLDFFEKQRIFYSSRA